MQVDRKDLKAKAREAMNLTRPKFWAVCLLYLLLTNGVDGVLRVASDTVTGGDSFGFFALFTAILYGLYSLVVQFGYNLWSLWTWRRLNPGAGSLLQGFSITGRVIAMELLVFLRSLGWGVLLSFLFALLQLLLLPDSLLSSLVTLGLVLAAVFFIMLRYALAPYLLADRPDDGPGAAVRRSVELMRGRKWELFKLYLSFFGWYLLLFLLSWGVRLAFLAQAGVLTLPLQSDLLLYHPVLTSTPAFLLSNLVILPLSLWLIPYTSVAQAGFYDSLGRLGRPGTYEEMPPL